MRLNGSRSESPSRLRKQVWKLTHSGEGLTPKGSISYNNQRFLEVYYGMESELAILKQFLGEKGYSLTKSRRKVFQALMSPEPQSMAEVVKKVGAGADRASVYRTVALFEELGVAERVQIGWKYKIELSEMFREHHHHLTCVRCERVVDVFGRYNLEVLIDSTARDADFEPLSHYLEIRGLCPACQKAE